jgi:hypothetical protein
MPEIRVLRRLIGPKRDEVRRGGRKVYNEQVYEFKPPQIQLQ